MPARRFYRFGPFRLDPVNRLLFQDDAFVSLTLKAFDTLLLLVENHGSVVSKEAMLKSVWPDAFVDENSIAQNISLLRKLFADANGSAEYIATIPRRGYRFVAPVLELTETESAADPMRVSDSSPPQTAAPARRIPLLRFVLLALIALAGTVGYFAVAHYRHKSAASPTQATLAVLPFVNLTGDPEQEYFSDGLTEEMITQLGRANPQQLAVIARTSSMAYKHATKTVEQIGRELGANYVLEGSVRGTAGHMRFTVQLIRVRDQIHLWTRAYDRAAADVLAAQSDVSHAVAEEVEFVLAPRALPSDKAAVGPEVYDLYLQGRFHWNKRTREGLAKGIDYFRQAIARDSAYAPAYAGLADCLFLQIWISELPREQVIPPAKAAARRAIELDPDLAEPHASLGIIAVAELDWREAEAELDRALELNSNYPTSHHWNGFRLAAIGRQAEGVAELRRAIALDPLSPILHTDLGWLLILSRSPEPAIQELNRALELDPNFYIAYEYLARAHELERQYPLAITEMTKAVELSGGKPELRARLGRVYALAGRTEEARHMLVELNQESKQKSLSSMFPAWIYSGLGDKDRELAMLERAMAEGNNAETSWFKVDPTYDGVRSDERFQRILHRAGFP